MLGGLAVAAVLLAFPVGASAAATSGEVWTATLSGGAEVPPVATGATGSATFVLTPGGSTIQYLVQYSGLSGTLGGAHIHLGAAGTNGGIMLPLVAGPSPMVGTLSAANFVATGSVTSFSAAIDAIRAGNTYVNLHTAANPAGEVRGQIGAASGAQGFGTPISGSQGVPSVSGSAAGQGTLVINAAGDTITYWVTYGGTTSPPAAGHIHLGAVGANGGILLPLSGIGSSPVVGTLNATNLTATGGVTTFAGALDAIRAGTTYFNLHTAANPGGEMRGQIGVTVAAPAPTQAPTPPATPAVTIPPTSTVDVAPASPGGSIGPALLLLALAGLLGALIALPATRRTRR
jgi:hypothetical protein